MIFLSAELEFDSIQLFANCIQTHLFSFVTHYYCSAVVMFVISSLIHLHVHNNAFVDLIGLMSGKYMFYLQKNTIRFECVSASLIRLFVLNR